MRKLIHLIALPSAEYMGITEYLCILSKMKHYPDYKIVLWVSQHNRHRTAEIVQRLGRGITVRIIPDEYYTNDPKWGIDHPNSNRARAYQSDHIRFCILRDYGGLYCDLDSFSLNRFPIERLVNKGAKTIIGMQTSTRYKGTSIHWIYSEPNSPFVLEYMRIRDQKRPFSGSAQNGFQALENLEVYNTTHLMDESKFTYPPQPVLDKAFSEEYIDDFTYSDDNYEIHLCGAEGLSVRNTYRVRRLLAEILTRH